jgi:hypothetical protein
LLLRVLDQGVAKIAEPSLVDAAPAAEQAAVHTPRGKHRGATAKGELELVAGDPFGVEALHQFILLCGPLQVFF